MTTAARLYRRELLALRFIQDVITKHPKATNAVITAEFVAAFLLALYQ